MFIGVWIYIWVFKSIPLVNIYVFMSMQYGYYYCCSLVDFEIMDGLMVIYLEVPLLYRIVLDILGFCFFHLKLTVLSMSISKCGAETEGRAIQRLPHLGIHPIYSHQTQTLLWMLTSTG